MHTCNPSYLRYSSKMEDRFHFCFFRKHATTIPVLMLPSSLTISNGKFETSRICFSAFTTIYTSLTLYILTVSLISHCILPLASVHDTSFIAIPKSWQKELLCDKIRVYGIYNDSGTGKDERYTIVLSFILSRNG